MVSCGAEGKASFFPRHETGGVMGVRGFGLAIAAFVVAMAAQPVRAQDEPRTYAEEVAQLRGMCEGGQLVFIAAPDRSTDFNGDGVNDIVSESGRNVGCVPNNPTENNSYGMVGCAAAGCQLHLYLSSPSGYRAAWHSAIGVSSWRIEGGPRPRIHLVDVYSCGDAGLSRCEFAIQWDGRRMTQTQLGRFNLERHQVPPELSPAWRVGTMDDGTKIVTTYTADTIPVLNLRCERGAPVLTLYPENRALRLAAVTIESGGQRAALAPRQNRDGTWSASPGTEAVDLLAGRASQAVLRANGAVVGRLSLAGSTAAVREALGNCADMAVPASVTAPTDGKPEDPGAAGSDELQIGALIEGIYGWYAQPHEGNGYAREASDFSPSLDALVARATARSDDGLGFDPFCECQDYENTSFAVQELTVTGATAEARVDFWNFGQQKTMTLMLVRTPAGWRVDDILGANGSFRASLRPSPARTRPRPRRR